MMCSNPIQYFIIQSKTFQSNLRLYNPRLIMATIAIPLRRSKRISVLPPVKYTQDRDHEVYDLLEDYCIEHGYTFSDELFAEYKTFLDSAPGWFRETHDYRLCSLSDGAIKKEIHRWIKWYCKSLESKVKLNSIKNYIIRYCNNNNISYNKLMLLKYIEWYQNPKTAPLISRKIRYVSPSDKSITFKTRQRDFTQHYCINKWFASLKKTVEL
jgi:hypothetical protein